MDQESITKEIISGIVDHYIQEIAQDPHRSIRKLVDMAEHTSDGPTQKICYQMMQKMASDQSSPYFEMIHHLVTHTNPETIKRFGINLGHNAWTFGSGNIRRLIAQKDSPISWVVIIDRDQKKERIPFGEIRSLVRRGRENEIYCWLLLASSVPDEWDEYAGLFRSHEDCAFGLRIPPAGLSEEILEEAAEIPNLMILLDTGEPDWQTCADRLSEKGLLYSACRTLSDEAEANEVTDGSWLEELVPFHPLMAFTVTSETLPETSAKAVKEYMWNTRLSQKYPVLPVDLISDFLLISYLVSHREILYRIETDGSVSFGNGHSFTAGGLNCADLFRTENPLP